MKKFIVCIFAFFIWSFAYAEELSSDSLQGSWRILTMNGQADEDEDYWEFKGNNFVQNLAGHRMSPDNYVVNGMLIDLGYAKIKVMEFGGDSMTADMAGYVYTLKKK